MDVKCLSAAARGRSELLLGPSQEVKPKLSLLGHLLHGPAVLQSVDPKLTLLSGRPVGIDLSMPGILLVDVGLSVLKWDHLVGDPLGVDLGSVDVLPNVELISDGLRDHQSCLTVGSRLVRSIDEGQLVAQPELFELPLQPVAMDHPRIGTLPGEEILIGDLDGLSLTVAQSQLPKELVSFHLERGDATIVVGYLPVIQVFFAVFHGVPFG